MNDFKNIEQKWNKYWEENNTFYTDIKNFNKPKYYVLGMFPYPSGVALHVGHAVSYIPTDVIARYKRMCGYNVLNPIGFDSFGLPSEQYAIDTGNNPADFTNLNIETFKEQLKKLGLSYDWSKEISTADPKYYKWTQWIFTEMFKDGLAKKINMPVNWCEELGTVLANDEVIDGKSERGGFPVIRKNMEQWIIDIPRYAEKLLEGLNNLDWPESTKEIQRNWIGKSIGAEVDFKVDNSDQKFTVFTTRADTLFGVTYCVLSPEHKLVLDICSDDNREKVQNYIKEVSRKSELERTDLNKNKTGVFIGRYAINPINNKKIPIYIADYVLNTYGTGAIMAVPAHDSRDLEFAKKFNLEIIKVLDTKENITDDAIHINSGFLDGLYKEEAIKKMIEYLEKNNIGKKKINYKMREWIFSRQRYWGEPIPIVDIDGESIALDIKDLPIVLPTLIDYRPFSNGDPALKRASEWYNCIYKGQKATRETLTMPGSAGSSWYYLRYIDPNNDNIFADKKLLDHWMPVDLYIGGSEHSCGHLLYSRMWNRYLQEKGYLNCAEPFKKLFHQGMVLGANGIKMGKRYKEFVIDPVDIIERYGADALRLYLMFMGPLEADKPWNNNGVEASKKFLERVERLVYSDKIKEIENPQLERIYHQTLKKVQEDYEKLRFNTAISQLMILVNEMYKADSVPKIMIDNLLKLLHPICPYITNELANKDLSYSLIDNYDETKIQEDTCNIAVQVNGKLRATLEIPKDLEENLVLDKALDLDNVKNYTEGTNIIKKIYIKNKIVNIVCK